jgi:hypothetical protein
VNLGFEGERAADRDFVPAATAEGSSERSWASFGPGGAPLSRPRPRLRPGAQVSAPHAVDRVWAGPHWAVIGHHVGWTR